MDVGVERGVSFVDFVKLVIYVVFLNEALVNGAEGGRLVRVLKSIAAWWFK